MREQGRYQGNITASVFAAAKNTGSPQFVIECEVFTLDGTPSGTAKVYLSCSDKAWDYTEPKLKRLGFNGDFEKPEFSNGQGINLTCKHEEYQGKQQEKWDLGGGMPQPAGADVTKTFAARWKSTNGAAPKPAGRPTPPPPPSAPAAPTPPPADQMTQEKAWGVFLEYYPTGDCQPQWQASIADVVKSSGKPFAKFGHAEWEAVAKSVKPPF